VIFYDFVGIYHDYYYHQPTKDQKKGPGFKIHWRPQESLQAGRDLVAGTLADTSIHDRGRVIQMTVGT
jgi:hypothetical protein